MGSFGLISGQIHICIRDYIEMLLNVYLLCLLISPLRCPPEPASVYAFTMYRRVLFTPVMRTRLCITPNIASPPPFVLEANTSHIIPKMAANESAESQERLVRSKGTINNVIDETLRRHQEGAIPNEDPERLVRWKTTLVSVIDETFRKHQENAIPNAQGAISLPPNFIDLLLWKGEALQSLPRYIQYLRPADLTRDTVPPWETPPPVGYGPKEWWKWSPDLTESEPESPESPESMSGIAGEVEETASGEDSEEMDGGNADDEGDDSSEDESWKWDEENYEAEYRRKWEHFERQERRRLRRGIGPPQLFRHPYIEETMWTRDTSSSEDPESDAGSRE
jgi:hypothetical protein